MKNPTIEEIVESTMDASPYFFNEDTLRGFGQTLDSFTVVRSPKGRIFIYAPSYWGKIKGNSHLRVNAFGSGVHRLNGNQYARLEGRELMGYTFREFTGSNLKTCDSGKDLESVLEFIENN